MDLLFYFLFDKCPGPWRQKKKTKDIDLEIGIGKKWEGGLSRAEELQVAYTTQSCFKKYQADENTMIISTQ